MFYVDVRNTDEYAFYYNMEAMINDSVKKVVDNIVLNNRPINAEAKSNIANRGYLKKSGSAHLGMMGSYNLSTKSVEYESALDMAGIAATVSRTLAERILERAIYYCPKDTGYLASTGRIEELDDGKCRVVFDCHYAWFVHEYTWKNHKFPEQAKFLTQAVYEIEKMAGYGWA